MLSAAVMLCAAASAFAFFTMPSAYSYDSSIVKLQAPERTPLPFRQTNIQSILVRNASPAVNSNRNENSSNPPLNRVYGALFQRTFIIFSVNHCTAFQYAALILRKKYLQNSIPARAGPFQYFNAA